MSGPLISAFAGSPPHSCCWAGGALSARLVGCDCGRLRADLRGLLERIESVSSDRTGVTPAEISSVAEQCRSLWKVELIPNRATNTELMVEAPNGVQTCGRQRSSCARRSYGAGERPAVAVLPPSAQLRVERIEDVGVQDAHLHPADERPDVLVRVSDVRGSCRRLQGGQLEVQIEQLVDRRTWSGDGGARRPGSAAGSAAGTRSFPSTASRSRNRAPLRWPGRTSAAGGWPSSSATGVERSR